MVDRQNRVRGKTVLSAQSGNLLMGVCFRRQQQERRILEPVQRYNRVMGSEKIAGDNVFTALLPSKQFLVQLPLSGDCQDNMLRKIEQSFQRRFFQALSVDKQINGAVLDTL